MSSSTSATKTSKSSFGLLTASSAKADLPPPRPHSTAASAPTSPLTSCPTFFQSFVKNQDVINCIPISLLLLNSNGFFNAEESRSTLVPLLDRSCAVNFGACRDLMASYAYQLKQTANCGADFQLFNPLVTQAFDGFVAYEPVYRATCLKATAASSSSGSDGYCFADAVTNQSTTVDSYPYYLPLGVSLSGRPACTSCLNQTMAIFNGFAGNASNPLSTTYKQAAQQINLGCGPSFANTNVQVVASAAMALLRPDFSLAVLISLIAIASTVVL